MAKALPRSPTTATALVVAVASVVAVAKAMTVAMPVSVHGGDRGHVSLERHAVASCVLGCEAERRQIGKRTVVPRRVQLAWVKIGQDAKRSVDLKLHRTGGQVV